jgi:hypothetical protein
MDDHWTDDDLFARDRILGGSSLQLDDVHTFPWILNHFDRFYIQARLNQSVDEVRYFGYSGDDQDDEIWDKLGQTIGNLQSLKKFSIIRDGRDIPASDFEILARILSHVRQKIEVNILHVGYWDAEQCRLFANVIHGHPTITKFAYDGYFPYVSLDVLFSVMATSLPALESIRLCGWEEETTPEDESALAHPESLTELLRVSTLRSVSFEYFVFTPGICETIANELIEDTAMITDLEFRHCSFSSEVCPVTVANGLSRFASVSRIKVVSPLDLMLFDALATVLPSNSTLRRLDLDFFTDAEAAHDLSPVLLALGKNRGIESFSLDGFHSMNETLCTAMKDGLGMNTTIESLELNKVRLTNDNYDLWSRTLSFLSINNTLKSLVVTLDKDVTESLATAFRTVVVAMLEENASLQSLSILGCTNEIQLEEFVSLITALQHNTALKSIVFTGETSCIYSLTDAKDKQMAELLKKNYALESLPDLNQRGDMGAILRLNAAGRRYLVQDGSSISKGVEVLIAVSTEINCVFLHLLENPRLCDRSAIEETASANTDTQGSTGSTSSENSSRKREQDQDQASTEVNESRRRRT